MRLSVVIPVYNAERYLCRCLDSVLAQTLHDIEVICIDDGSTDGSAAILAEYAAKDARIRVLTQENRGQGVARNRGLEVAQGEYIYFVDADDGLARTDAVERVVGMMESLALDMALFDADTRFDDGCRHLDHLIRTGSYIRRHDYCTPRTGAQMLADMYRHNEWTASPPLSMLRRDMLTAAGVSFPEGIIHEDNIFMLRAFLAAKWVAHRPWRLYVRCVHVGTTVTRPLSIENLRGYLECWRFVRGVLSAGCCLSHRVRRTLNGLALRYKWHVRNVARRLGEPFDRLYGRLSDYDAEDLRQALAVSCFENVGNAIQCLRDNGFAYTLRRILFGRRD